MSWQPLRLCSNIHGRFDARPAFEPAEASKRLLIPLFCFDGPRILEKNIAAGMNDSVAMFRYFPFGTLNNLVRPVRPPDRPPAIAQHTKYTR